MSAGNSLPPVEFAVHTAPILVLIGENLNVRRNRSLVKNIDHAEEPGNALPLCALPSPSFLARNPRQQGGYAMWASLFAVTVVIALGFSLAAIVMESREGGKFRL